MNYVCLIYIIYIYIYKMHIFSDFLGSIWVYVLVFPGWNKFPTQTEKRSDVSFKGFFISLKTSNIV